MKTVSMSELLEAARSYAHEHPSEHTLLDVLTDAIADQWELDMLDAQLAHENALLEQVGL
jgi:hypothetical protein